MSWNLVMLHSIAVHMLHMINEGQGIRNARFSPCSNYHHHFIIEICIVISWLRFWDNIDHSCVHVSCNTVLANPDTVYKDSRALGCTVAALSFGCVVASSESHCCANELRACSIVVIREEYMGNPISG